MHCKLPPGEYWKKLAAHYQATSAVQLSDLFAADPDRAERFSVEAGPLYLDYSRNHLTDETVWLLVALANDAGLSAAIERLFSGAIVNCSENRAALHTALRDDPGASGLDPEIAGAVAGELERMTTLHEQLAVGRFRGFSGKPIDTVVNIGIGGSDLGPRLLANAFAHERDGGLQVHFVANMDPADIHSVLDRCCAETTLFVLSSKSFTTLETLNNFAAARDWLRRSGCPDEQILPQFLAATANPQAAEKAGIAAGNIYRFWDWVGGRYSVWSAAGLAGFLAVGPERFREFLAGASAMDRHFRAAPAAANLPVLLALIGLWNINFRGCDSHAIVPYDQRLSLLPDYLCQLAMESTGKSVTTDGEPVRWQTGPVTWGGVGTNAQHSFFQALHQGTRTIPVDFLVAVENPLDIDHQHASLFISCLAQSRALMTGADSTEAHRRYPGNRPSNTLLYDSLRPATLGAILAAYEHKTYIQALLWGINPFDQWGVELGKATAHDIAAGLQDDRLDEQDLDGSTRKLLQRFHGRG